MFAFDCATATDPTPSGVYCDGNEIQLGTGPTVETGDVEVSLITAEGAVDTLLELDWERYRPNGAVCPPVCGIAEATVHTH